MVRPAPARRAVPLALVTLLVLAGFAASASTFLLETSNRTANESTPMRPFDAPGVAVGDFDGDGRAELVAQSENRVAYVLATDRATVLAELRPPYPSGWGARAINEPAVGDLDRDGRLDVVLVTSAATVCDYEFDPFQSTFSRFTFREMWCTRLDAFDGSVASSDSGAWLEDVDGDGKLEVFAQTEDRGLFALNADGRVRWARNEWAGNAGPTVGDLDGDGRKEVVFFSDGGRVRALDASKGHEKWVFHASQYVQPASIPVSGVIGDLEGDGRKEVVFIARDAHDATNYRNNHFMLFVLDSAGRVKWKTQPSWGNPMSYTHPVLVDVNNDGKKDVVAQDWNTIGHKPGNWERLGPANVFAYSHAGQLLWRRALDNPWSNDGLVVGDFDGDTREEVLAIGTKDGKHGVWRLSLRSGWRESWVSTRGWEPLRGPVAGDFEGSGGLQWAIPVKRGSEGALLFYDAGARCKVTFGGWQNRSPCDPPG